MSDSPASAASLSFLLRNFLASFTNKESTRPITRKYKKNDNFLTIVWGSMNQSPIISILLTRNPDHIFHLLIAENEKL